MFGRVADLTRPGEGCRPLIGREAKLGDLGEWSQGRLGLHSRVQMSRA